MEKPTTNERTVSEGCYFRLGSISMESAHKNWMKLLLGHQNSQKLPTISPHTILIVEAILGQLAETGEVEVTEALQTADRLMPSDATPEAWQHHFDRCVEAADVMVSILRYTTYEFGGHQLHAAPETDMPTSSLPVVVPTAA